MQILIKQIREHLNISQTELAEQLNVTFATVNRWENGRAVPNKLAQSKLYEICKENDVPVYNITLNRIANAAKDISLSEGRVLLYHGSKSGIEGKIEPKSRAQCDFGKGFYMVTEPIHALELICDNDKSKFYIVSVDTTTLNTIEVPADIEWAMLVAYHRGRMETIKGTPLYEKYRKMSENKDLVIGSIANDRMFYVIDNFFIGKQYVAVTQKGCDAVRIEVEVELSHLERMFIQEVAEANRAKGVSLANDICKNYRREGLFFDEILEKAQNGG